MDKKEIEDLVNNTKKVLGVTQAELGLLMGVSDEAPTQWKSTGKISKMAITFMNFLVKDHENQKKIKELEAKEETPNEHLNELVKALKTVDEIKGRY